MSDKIQAYPPLRRNRDFQLFWIGSAISLLGSRGSAIAYPLLILGLTGSAADAGVVGFTATLPHLLLQLPLGALADKWNRRRMLIGTDVGRLLLLAGVASSVALGFVHTAWIAVAVFIEGTLTILAGAVEPGALRQLVPHEQFPDALARQVARERAAVLLGQPLGGALYSVQRAVPFVADAVSYLVSLISVLLIRRPLQEADSDSKKLKMSRTEIVRGLAWLWARPFFRSTTLLIAGSNFLFQVLTLALIVSATEQKASPFLVGVIIAGSGVGGILGAAVAPRVNRALPLPKVILTTHWVWAAIMPVFIFLQVPVAYTVLFAGLAFVGPLWNVSVMAARVSATPDEMQGRVATGSKVLTFGAIPLGSLAGGFALEAVGTTVTFVALAGFMLLLAVLATLLPSIQRGPVTSLRTEEEETVPDMIPDPGSQEPVSNPKLSRIPVGDDDDH